MSQVIFIHKQDDFASLVELNLEIFVGATVIFMDSARKTIELLKRLPHADLIISANEIGVEKTALDIHKYLKTHERKIPLLVMGYNRLLEKKTFMTKEKTDWRSVIRSSARILGISPKDLAEKIVPEFYPLDLKYFQSVRSVGTDVYIRISKSKSKEGFQYIKRYRAGDTYDEEIIEKYKKHGVTHLYIPKENRLKFVQHFTEEITERLKEQTLQEEQKITATSDAFYAFGDYASEVGLDEKSIALAQGAISSMTTTVEQATGLDGLLKLLKQNEGNFLFNHSLLTAYVGHKVLNELLMGTKEQQQVFIFVAFFHDVMLRNESYAKIHHESELNQNDLSANDKKNIESHALDACNLLRQYPQVPMGAPMAIKQHHLSLSGVGFTSLPSERVTPLAQVFRVVEDFATFFLLDENPEKNKMAFIEKMRAKYQKYTYAQVIPVLEGLILN